MLVKEWTTEVKGEAMALELKIEAWKAEGRPNGSEERNKTRTVKLNRALWVCLAPNGDLGGSGVGSGGKLQ